MKAPVSLGLTLILIVSAVSDQIDVKTTELQLRVCRGLWNAVNDHYVYPDFRGHDWEAIGAKYRARIQGGMNNDEFYAAMQAMLGELGDEHSYFQSPAQIKAEQAARASQYNFVGIGALMLPIKDTDQAVIMTVFRDGPAAQAGLRSHDIILKVDGGPVREKDGRSRTMGPDGSTVVLTVRRPGEPPRDVTLPRRQVTGSLPIDYRLVPHTRIGYVFLPTLLDETIADQTREALKKLTADGPLGGLVLDNRMNGGGLGNVERLRSYDFEDGSRAWIASETFEPRGQANGIWEETGIIPDVNMPTRWHEVTEANDPALAKAVELLRGQKKPPSTVS